MTPSLWRGRRILLTGHTGFKGAWASLMLADLGAEVTAFSLALQTEPNLWQLIEGRIAIAGKIADLRDASAVAAICRSVQPEIVLHMAGQARVRDGYRDPVGTFSTNVIGSVNLRGLGRRIGETSRSGAPIPTAHRKARWRLPSEATLRSSSRRAACQSPPRAAAT
jgi:CDP-glucose 4,6-dehydratase